MSTSSPAQSSLIARLRLIYEAVGHDLLIDKELTNVEHNRRAQMLRSGLTVAAFTSVEDFIRVRTGELLVHISRTVVRFEQLPDGLRRAATTEAMRAAYEQAKLMRKRGEDPFPMVQQAATEIASTGNGPLMINKVRSWIHRQQSSDGRCLWNIELPADLQTRGVRSIT